MTDTDSADTIASLRAEVERLRTYAHEATKAITGLTAGGSEYFSGEMDGIYLADLPLCVERIRARFATPRARLEAWEEAWKGARCNELRLEEALRRIINRADPERLSPIQYEASRAAAKIAQEAIDARAVVDVPASDRETACSEPGPVDFPRDAFPAPVQLPVAGENGNYGYAHDPHDQVRDDAARSAPVQPAGDVGKAVDRFERAAFARFDNLPRKKSERDAEYERRQTEYDTARSALLASRHLPVGEGWRPIETAPKGCVTEDAGCRGESEWFFGRTAEKYRKLGSAPIVTIRRRPWPHDDSWADNGETFYVPEFFDAWMPLPQPPLAASNGEDGR